MYKYIIHLTVPLLVMIACSPPPHLRKNYTGSRAHTYQGSERKRVVSTAKRYLGVPYRYGGTTPRGFDCSGFVAYVFRRNGVPVTRSLAGQYCNGKKISRYRLKPGDLVFFQTGRKRLSHVGIYVGSRRFIHAPRTGKRISYADMNNPYWRKRFRGAVSYFETGSRREKNGSRKRRNRDSGDFSETVHYF